MTLSMRIGFIVILFAAAFTSGFFYGRAQEREKALMATANAYETAGEVQNEISKLSDYALCLDRHGLPEDCKIFLRRVDETATDK